MTIHARTVGRVFVVPFVLGITVPGICAAALKLPYPAGTAFMVAQGYHALPTHIGKDAYAIDFTQDGCDAYGRSAVAAVSGRVIFASARGYNGGYGTEVLMESASGTRVIRYAHLIPGSLVVASGTEVFQGQRIGAIGNTGFVEGGACAAHPGTHLHFAVYDILANGSYGARDPEPLSGYTSIAAGTWYRSDNAPPLPHEPDPSGGDVVRETSSSLASSSSSALFSFPSERPTSSPPATFLSSSSAPSSPKASSSDVDEDYCPE